MNVGNDGKACIELRCPKGTLAISASSENAGELTSLTVMYRRAVANFESERFDRYVSLTVTCLEARVRR